MKKIIQPEQHEKAEYISDFSNKSFGNFYPPVEITIQFNYGSKFDGSLIKFHLEDDEAKHILDFIHMNLSSEKINQLRKKLKENEEFYEENMNARDWQSCDYFNNNIELYRYLLNEHNQS